MEKRELISIGVSIFALILIVSGVLSLFSVLASMGFQAIIGTLSLKGSLPWFVATITRGVLGLLFGLIMLKKNDSFVNLLATKTK